jgi:hypothetical protein
MTPIGEGGPASRPAVTHSLLFAAVAALGTGCGGGADEDGDPVGGIERAQASTTPAPAPVSVQHADVVYAASASNPDSYRYTGIQCQGTNWYFWEWGGSSARWASKQPDPVTGVASGTSFNAFSSVASPGETSKRAFRWELHASDPDTAGAGAKRCEMRMAWKEYSYPGKVFARQIGLPANKNNWWAVAVRTEDWSASARSNDWQILWQWHDSYGGDLPPFLDLAAKGNEWYLQATYDTHSTPSTSTLTRLTLWSGTVTPKTWQRFVVKARKDLSTPGNSFVQIWLNGKQIVNYRGPFGYHVTQLDYAKVGLYHWISSKNLWDSVIPARRMWSKGPVLVSDRSGYTWQSINAMLD